MKADGIGQAEAAGDGAGPGAAQTGQAGQAGGQWAFWWRDARPFRRRLGLAGAAAVAPAFLLFIFGPLDIFQKNAAEFPFTAADLLKPMLVVFGLAALVMLGALAALRGRVFDLAVSLLLGLTLAAWVQGTFLNTDYGELTGVAIRWERYARLALANTAIWAALTAAPLILRLVSRKIWTVAAWLAPAALVLSCAAALGSDYASLSASGQPERQALAPTYAGLFTASSAANQYIFVLDMMDQKFVTEIEAEDPEFFSRHLDGFTQFDANISNYTRTLPSAADMLTGQRYQFDEPLDQYFGRAYKHGDFLPNLRAAGYSTNIYATDRYSYFNINDIVGFADNVKPAKRRIALKPMLKGMLLLDAFRYAPHIAKPFFWTAADQFAGAAPVLDPDSPFTSDNFAFKELLAAEGVTLGGDQPRFSYIHLDGAHNPAIMDRQANRVPRDSVSLTEQAMGAFSLAFAYLDQLKRIGAYKGASIVITADHGHWTEDADAGPLAAPRLTALFVKPAGAEGAPLAHSLAPTQMENVRATLLAEAGARPSGGPPTVFELSADSAEPRDFFYRRGQNVDEGLIDHWQVTGDARNWENWHFVAGNRTLYWG
jgi:hypothetical protein